MLQVRSQQKLEVLENALRRAANRHDAHVLAVSHVGQLVNDPASSDAISVTVCQEELYAALLAAEIRMAAYLPCRIAAYSKDGQAFLETVSPVEFCRLLNRPDLAPLAAPLAELLGRIMEDAAAPAAVALHGAASLGRGGLGATEEQVNARGSIPQRIDCRGTKVEELAGTGEHDAQGG